MRLENVAVIIIIIIIFIDAVLFLTQPQIFAQHPYLWPLMWALVTVLAAVIIERLFTRWVNRIAQRSDMSRELRNGLILTSRLLILVGAGVILLNLGGVPTEILISLSAIAGAAIGFASTRTLGNLIAGIYLLITRPFRVGDYIRLVSVGQNEGIVNEITINYTKILTPHKTEVLLTNQQILEREIVGYRIGEEEGRMFHYSVELGFDHSLSIEKLEETLETVIARYEGILKEKPEYKMIGLTDKQKRYMLYFAVTNPEDVFTLKSQLLREITQAWETAKAGTRNPIPDSA